MADFIEFPKIARLSREVIISEKIDGTNGCIYIGDIGENGQPGEFLVGSRTRWITPEKDNHGFAKWVYEHESELIQLGPGRHFGEWWGSGIQRGYGLPKGEKRFSLFNVIRWCLHDQEPQQISVNEKGEVKMQQRLPTCVGLIPILYRGMFSTIMAQDILDLLAKYGSHAAPGFMNPEGIVVYHIAGNVAFKKTIEKDDEPKRKQK